MKLQTKSNEVLDKAVARDSASYYFLEEDFEWQLWVREIRPLQATARAEWDATMGVLYALVGRFADADQCFRNSLRLEYSPSVVANWIMSVFASGQYSRVQELYAEYGNPTNGAYTLLWRAGLDSCALEIGLSYRELAIQMCIETPEYHQAIDQVRTLLRTNGLSDADVARHMDVAGKICVRHRIKPCLKRIYAGTKDVGEMLSILFVVPKDANEVFEMNIELAQAEEELGINKLLAFDVAFTQALPSDFESGRGE